jgi:SNF2 family DNA or RNA helicase
VFVPSARASETIGYVQEALIKWKSLPYSEACWDKFNPEDIDFPSFKTAFDRYMREKDIVIPRMNASQLARISAPRPSNTFKALEEQPTYVGGKKALQLMPFQMLGVNWLLYKWWCRANGVLSDEMGLGKTVQVIAALSIMYKQEHARPFLVVVPNSTIGNWVREFETWGPSDMRVVAYFGSSASRAVCAENDLFTRGGANPLLRAHVVVCPFTGARQRG